MKKIFLTASAIVLVFLGTKLFTKSDYVHKDYSIDSTPKSPERLLASTISQPKKNKTKDSTDEFKNFYKATITQDDVKKFQDNYPSAKIVNDEIRNQPHAPSKTLMSFADRMAPLMEKALKNEKDAEIVVSELANCAINESVAKEAKALCVTNTERLAQTFPKFDQEAKNVRASISPDVEKILKINDAAIKK